MRIETGSQHNAFTPTSFHAGCVGALLNAQRVRQHQFGTKISLDPCWNMLLALYWAHIMRRRMEQSELLLEAGVPETTAFRWIIVLRKEGLVTTEVEHGTCREGVGLTEAGVSSMRTYISTIDSTLRGLGAFNFPGCAK